MMDTEDEKGANGLKTNGAQFGNMTVPLLPLFLLTDLCLPGNIRTFTG